MAKVRKSVRRKTRELAKSQIRENGHKAIGTSHGGHRAFLFMNSYYRNNLDQRSHLGQLTMNLEAEYATHCGYSDYDSCPITLREQIRLLIGNYLFQCFYIPSDKTYMHLKASENLTHRITRELGLQPVQKNVMDLPTYIAQKEGEQ